MLLCFVVCRYSLKPPNESVVCEYIDNVVQQLNDCDVDKDTIVKKFCEKFQHPNNEMSESDLISAACKLVAKRLVHENLSVRKTAVGKLVKAIRNIREQPLDDSMFEQGLHSKSSELFHAETTYKVLAAFEETVVDHVTIAVDENAVRYKSPTT